MALLELKNIKKTYNEEQENEFEALKGVDIKIEEGEFIAIMGPSGSGKTTLMNIIGALDTPSSGEYLIRGENISSYNDNELADFRNQDIGFVFQQFNLLPRNNVLENVLLPTLYGKLDDKEAVAKKMLKKVGIWDKKTNLPNQLSGGQVQRVAIARALMMNPTIILADEPTGNLDSVTAKEVMEVLQQLNKEGRTILVVTHEDEVANFTKRRIYLRDGRVSK